MSKSVASKSNEGHESREISGKRGAEGEGDNNEEGIIAASPAATLSTLTTVSTVPAPVDDFMHTIEFKRLFAPFVHEQTLMALRVLNKEWNGVADVIIDEGVESGAMMVRGSKIMQWPTGAKKERRKTVRWVIFLLNITKVGGYSCMHAINLVVVDIPEGIKRIGWGSFNCCKSLTTVSFPRMLTAVHKHALKGCDSLDNVHLLNTNLQEVGQEAFWSCKSLTTVSFPKTLKSIAYAAFRY